MINKIQKFREYLDFIENHYNNIQKSWKEIQEKCGDMRFVYDDYIFYIIDRAVKLHDESKLSVAGNRN